MNSNFATIFILIFILILAVVGILYLTLGSHRKPKLNVTKFRERWLAIENNLDRNNEASWQLAIFSADKLVDQALRDSKYKGKTMGERLKDAQKTWSNGNHIWGAHKIRNQLAHETDAKLSYDLARRALSAYKQALKDLGAI